MKTLTRINATIPQSLADFADFRIESGGFGNKSEYIRYLIRKDQESSRLDEIDYINRKLKDSIASGLSHKTPDQVRSDAQAVIRHAVLVGKC
jgi:putative addiction module CopG family antidote